MTICAFRRECLFGKINNNHMQLNELGKIVKNEWLKTPYIRPDIELDEFIVMPNHFHGIVIINEPPNNGDNCRGVLQCAPTDRFRSPSQNIGSIIRGFKSTVTKQINILRNTPAISVWHRNYYDRIIRNDMELNKTREYIIANPEMWDNDEENLVNFIIR